MMHEASLHDDNCFVTLTYAEEYLPRGGTLVKEHFQDFMKRLRSRYSGRTIRYYHCGEYGEDLCRPHYHAALFNYRPNDLKPYKKKNGNMIYTSKSLEKLWNKGFVTVGDLTVQSAGYISRYVTKKIVGPQALDHYWGLDPRTGELFEIEPEYATMSLKPGLGKGWLDKYMTDVYPDDFIIINGSKMKVPRYYDKLFGRKDEKELQKLKVRRINEKRSRREDATPARLEVRRKCKEAKIRVLKRSYESNR